MAAARVARSAGRPAKSLVGVERRQQQWELAGATERLFLAAAAVPRRKSAALSSVVSGLVGRALGKSERGAMQNNWPPSSSCSQID